MKFENGEVKVDPKMGSLRLRYSFLKDCDVNMKLKTVVERKCIFAMRFRLCDSNSKDFDE